MKFRSICGALALQLVLVGSGLTQEPAPAAPPPGYEELTGLFDRFRAIAEPQIVNGVPDYSAAAMADQHAQVRAMLAELEQIDDSAWPIPRRVDYMLVLAELRGLDFQHRVVRPWARDPGFYSTTNLGFGPKMAGAMPAPSAPVPADERNALIGKLNAVPAILAQARSNLTDARGDLARLAIQQKNIEQNVYAELARKTAQDDPELAQAAENARAATAEFIAWLESVEASLPAYGGVGRENYDWYLKHVLLFPYSWEEMRILAQREYERSMTFLKIEEHEHKGLPMIEPAETLEEFERRRNAADHDILEYFREKDVITVPDWLEPPVGEGPYVLPGDRDPEKGGPFEAPIRRHFFRQAEDRNPHALRAHNLPGHLFDQMMGARDTRPIRSADRLYFIDGPRIEGWAFYLEEFILQAGLLDSRPNARIITYILQAKRAARVLPELKLHSNEWSYDEALASLTTRTPKWMGPQDSIARFDLELYLRQPGYGIGYYMGKVHLEALLSERAQQLGDDFDLKEFHDAFHASGLIPISLIRWEMTGRGDEIAEMR